MIKYITQIIFYLLFFQSGCSVAIESYPYEPEVVVLEGELVMEERFGPPNYGESPETDQRLSIYVLKLVNPITVGTANSLSEMNDSPVEKVVNIQVVFEGGFYLEENPVDRQVTLKGSLSKQLSSHDFYPVILRVKKADR